MHPFRKLLLISVGQAACLDKDMAAEEWTRLYHMVRKQTLTGVMNRAVHLLPASQQPGESFLRQWDEEAAKIARVYRNHEQHVSELEELLAQLGLHGCILKGTGLARLYPVPESRMCGDIDLWVRGTHDAILDAFENADIPIYDVLYQECKAGIFLDTEVEIHFHASKMYNPFSNARLQRYLEDHSPIREDVTLTYPDARFNAVFCMAHMYRHYLEGGIGLRQMMDYHYVLRRLDPADRPAVMKDLKYLRMKRFTASVMAVMRQVFGLETQYLLCPPDMKHGRLLARDVLSMGNFGILDRRNYTYDGESRWAAFLRKNRRVFSNVRYYPREILWSPFARVSQFVWRWYKGYL